MPDAPSQSSQQARQAIYDQDCHFARYQDGLKWSRFQTASAIEAGCLYAAFQAGLESPESIVIMLLGTILILLLWALVIIDENKYFAHLRRAENFEASTGAPLAFWKISKILLPSRYAMAAIIVFNLAAIGKLFAKLS